MKPVLKLESSEEPDFLTTSEPPESIEVFRELDDFSSLISQVIEKLPGYCEQGRMMEKREKKDCARRARRIRERIEKRKTDISLYFRLPSSSD